jgi:sulfonate transport system substrate-binding protein
VSAASELDGMRRDSPAPGVGVGGVRRRQAIRVGGVDEHFNLPWKLAIEAGAFETLGVDVTWTNCPGGTGQIADALESGSIDVATCLTEGILTAISTGHRCRLHSLWVESPLDWGVHVATDSPLVALDDLRADDVKFAISRPGSGSELMSLVLADQRRWGWAMPAADRFVTVHNIDGAVEALTATRTAQAFLWNKSMTTAHPTLRRIGEIHTPWPSFVVAVGSTARQLLPLIDSVVLVALASARFFLANQPEQLIQKHYGLDPELTRDWVRGVRFGRNADRPSADVVRSVVACMKRVGRIKANLQTSAYLAPATNFEMDLCRFYAIGESHEHIDVGGLRVYVVRTEPPPSPRPLRALFLLHARTGSLASVLDRAEDLVRRARALGVPLLVLAVELRNHGQRMLDSQLNGPMSGDGLEMFANVLGTARDVSFVMDVLPGKLSLRGERIERWGIVGISMGAHVCLVAAMRDSRFATCVSLIGCADYAWLMSERIRSQRALQIAPDATIDDVGRLVLGDETYNLIARCGAMNISPDCSGTSFLLLGARGDPLVSPRYNARFVAAMAAHPRFTVRDHQVDEHKVTPAMWTDACTFVEQNFFV